MATRRPKSKLQFEIKNAADGQFYVVIRDAENQTTLATSEPCETEKAAFDVMTLIIMHARKAVFLDRPAALFRSTPMGSDSASVTPTPPDLGPARRQRRRDDESEGEDQEGDERK